MQAATGPPHSTPDAGGRRPTRENPGRGMIVGAWGVYWTRLLSAQSLEPHGMASSAVAVLGMA
jgi:hypothetical protein